MKNIILFLLFSLMATYVAAEDYIVGQYKNVRSMGMGGTAVVAGLDESALIYNPALLKVMKGHKILFPGIAVMPNADSKDLMDSIQDLKDDIDKVEGDQNMLELLKAYIDGVTVDNIDSNGDGIADDSDIINANKRKIPNQYLQVYFSSFVGFVKEGMGFGVFTNARSSKIGLTGNKVNPSIIINGDGTVEVPFGVAFKLFNKLNIGASVRYIESARLNKELHYTELSDLSQDNLSTEGQLSIMGVEKARGVGFNFGAVMEFNKLNFAMSLQDPFTKLQTSKYVLKTGSTTEYKEKDLDKKSLPANLSIGLSNKPYKEDGSKTRLFWAVELQNLLNKDLNNDGFDDDNFYKKIHAGAEFTLLDTALLDLSLRGGLNQGYPTFGAAVKFILVELEYAYFTEELGSHLGLDKNKVQSLALNVRF